MKGSRQRWRVTLSGRASLTVREYHCKRCGSYFTSPKLGLRRYDWDVVREAVELYYDTRGSYRRVMKALRRRGVRVNNSQIYRWIDALGERCKSTLEVARELHPRWSGFLGLDSKVVKVGGEERILLMAVDLGTQDVAHSSLVKREDFETLSIFLSELRRDIEYEPKIVVVDLDPAWIKAVREIFLGVPMQGCVVHVERVVDRAIPKRKRTPEQEELKGLIKKILYARNLKESRRALRELLGRRGEWARDIPSMSAYLAVADHYPLLTAHLKVKGSYRDNNVTESVIDKIEAKLKIVRGFQTESTASNSLKLAVMHYRFNPFLSSKNGRNGKSPLMLAGVNADELDWVNYCQAA